jgi:type II secretory pathway pseudopilin PulG
MKKNLHATSIIEAMVVLLIIVTGITGVYSLLDSSSKLADATGKRIEAIQIARDGLEAFTTIRNTNWMRFAADYENCWNVENYNIQCVWASNSSHTFGLSSTEGYIIYKNSDDSFMLAKKDNSGWDYQDTDYRDNFAIQKDSAWLYTQSWGTLYGVNTTPFYTREIQIDYLNAAGASQWSASSNHPMMKVTAKVQWIDSAKKTPQVLEVSTVLSNWEGKR